MVSLHDYNENLVIEKLSKQLSAKKIVLISDAGSPLISDPGYKLIRHCIKNKIEITSIPGPSAIIPALQLSGISSNEFYFAGFIPKSGPKIIEFINKIKEKGCTSVFFVSSHKLNLCLKIMKDIIGNRYISVSKELTKINENTFRGFGNELEDIISKYKVNLKGEFVVVVERKSLKKTKSTGLDIYNNEINKLLLKFSLTDVVEIVHKLTGISKNKVYKWVLNLKNS